MGRTGKGSMKKEYLGDGCFVETDSYGNVILTTSDGIEDTNTIFLEPYMFNQLVRFVKRIGTTDIGDDVPEHIWKEFDL